MQGACKQTSGSHSGTCKHLKLHRDKPRFTGETYGPASTGPSPSERFSTPIVPRPPTVGSCGQAHQPLKELDVSTATYGLQLRPQPDALCLRLRGQPLVPNHRHREDVQSFEYPQARHALNGMKATLIQTLAWYAPNVLKRQKIIIIFKSAININLTHPHKPQCFNLFHPISL